MINLVSDRRQVKLSRRLSVGVSCCQLFLSLIGILAACLFGQSGGINGMGYLFIFQIIISVLNFVSCLVLFVFSYRKLQGKVERIVYSDLKTVLLCFVFLYAVCIAQSVLIGTFASLAKGTIATPVSSGNNFIYIRMASDFQSSFEFNGCRVTGPETTCVNEAFRTSSLITWQKVQDQSGASLYNSCRLNDSYFTKDKKESLSQESDPSLRESWCRVYSEFAANWAWRMDMIALQTFIHVGLGIAQLFVLLFIRPWVKKQNTLSSQVKESPVGCPKGCLPTIKRFEA